MTNVIESEGRCRGCGETFVLRHGFCDRCWNKAEQRRQQLLAKGSSPALLPAKAISRPTPTEAVSEPPSPETISESQDVYYVMRNGELVKATADEFLAAIAGGRYYK